MYSRMVTFKLKSGIKAEDMIQAVNKLRPTVEGMEGLIDIKIADLGDDIYMSYACYKDEISAARNMDVVNSLFKKLENIIDLTSLNIIQGPVVWNN